MPRELFHWKVLHSAIATLDPASRALEVVSRYPDVAELGAVAHDATYYLDGGRSKLSSIGNVLHGSRGNNALLPLLGCCNRSKEFNRDSAQRAIAEAFVYGLFSHAVTDSIMHPFIFYFTGDYHDKDSERRRLAQQRHRILEVYLDMWVRESEQSWSECYISSRLENANEYRALIEDIFAHGLLPGVRAACPTLSDELVQEFDSEYAANVYQGLCDMAWYQKVFFSNASGFAAWLLAKAAPRAIAPLEALCLFGRSKQFQAELDKSFSYLNPITGEEHTESLSELLASAIAKTSETFFALSQEFDGEKNEYPKLMELLGEVSLDYGIRVAGREPKYFSTRGIDLLGLQIA